MIKPYDEETEAMMKTIYSKLSESQKRLYAAGEVKKLYSREITWGSKLYISKLFGLTRRTLDKGLLELDHPELFAQIPEGKIRRPGGGRKKKKKVANLSKGIF